MKKIVHKSAAPIYAAAVVWVLYALLLPLYKPGHFIMAAAASVVVFLIARIFCKDVVEEVEEKPQPTGNPELDKMVSDGELAIREMRLPTTASRTRPSAGRSIGWRRFPARSSTVLRQIPRSCRRSVNS